MVNKGSKEDTSKGDTSTERTWRDETVHTADLGRLPVLVTAYVVVTLGTLVVLAVLSTTSPALATDHAWGHAIVAAVFAVLLPLRLRSARGSWSALRAVGIIAAVILLANVVEALIPGFAPGWMRWEMVGVALLMAGVVGAVIRITLRRR
jgi:hypothetical protein